jgi:DNA-binding CsgD family transcriptional regulator
LESNTAVALYAPAGVPPAPLQANRMHLPPSERPRDEQLARIWYWWDRNHRAVESRHPFSNLAFACVEETGERLEHACAVRDSWKTHLAVRLIDVDDSFWLNVSRTATQQWVEDEDESTGDDVGGILPAVSPQRKNDLGSDYLELAARHPNITEDERNSLAAGIFKYVRILGFSQELLRRTSLVDDAANAFALHVLTLMDEGKYRDEGTFKGWLSKVWSTWHWREFTADVAEEQKKFLGLQTWNRDQDDERAEFGRVVADEIPDFVPEEKHEGSAFLSVRDHEMDAKAARFHRKYNEVLHTLTPAERRIVERKLEGATDGEVAGEAGISTKTVQRRLKAIESKAKTKAGVIVSLQGCAERLLTSLEVARLLSVPEGTLRQWRCLGVGPAYHKIGRGVRYTERDIDAYVSQSRRVPSVRENTEGFRDSA